MSEEGGAGGGAVDLHDLFFGEGEYIYGRRLVRFIDLGDGGKEESEGSSDCEKEDLRLGSEASGAVREEKW